MLARIGQKFRIRVWDKAAWSEESNRLGKDKEAASFVKVRWEASLDLLTKRHTRDVMAFFILRSLSVLSGVAVTALSGLGLSGHSSNPEVRWLIFALGFIVAGSASIEQLGHFGQHRLLSRVARDDLLSAGVYLFFGGPNGGIGAFDHFRSQVEGILTKYNAAYNRTIADNGPH